MTHIAMLDVLGRRNRTVRESSIKNSVDLWCVFVLGYIWARDHRVHWMWNCILVFVLLLLLAVFSNGTVCSFSSLWKAVVNLRLYDQSWNLGCKCKKSSLLLDMNIYLYIILQEHETKNGWFNFVTHVSITSYTTMFSCRLVMFHVCRTIKKRF